MLLPETYLEIVRITTEAARRLADGAPDIYVCNDFKSPDRIWLTDGKGHFRALPRLAIRQTSLTSMGGCSSGVIPCSLSWRLISAAKNDHR